MKLTRREVLVTGATAAGAVLLSGCQTSEKKTSTARTPASGGASIDRQAVVSRHNPRVQKLDPYSALTVGNGTFAFTADVTGLQTFLDPYDKDFPLCTMATWAWHTTPHGPDIDPAAYKYKLYDSHGRKVPYDTDQKSPTAIWMRENPHRMHLGRIALLLKNPDGSDAKPSDLIAIDQTLDLWSGTTESKFEFTGQIVRVITCVHPKLNALAVRIESSLIRDQKLSVRIAFPYPVPAVDMADWNSPDKHHTVITSSGKQRADLSRTIDQDRYRVAVVWDQGNFAQSGPNEFTLVGAGDAIEFTVAFTADDFPTTFPTVAATQRAAQNHWSAFWSDGAIIDLAASTDPRAPELERRVILSAYNTALHCAGPMPPSETGLLFNSWYGKSHLEMHWWHGVHFAAWNRLPLFERSLDFYQRILPVAKEIATRQGYDGVRWPKMVGPDGLDSPSGVGPLLIWQQPHPIYYAELCYQRHPTRQTLAQWRTIVEETANFMASFAALEDNRYVLGPPLKTVSENTDQLHTMNPTFELTYWRFGLSTAQLWRKRLGLAPNPKWADVLARLSPLPQAEGRYLFQEGTTDTYTKWNYEHPAILGAYGMQPGMGVDPETMRNSLHEIMRVWQWDKCWGWDFPMTSMTAARLGERDLAFDALLILTPKNDYHPNGHVYQRPGLTAYLPANGGLLSAMALLAVGAGNAPHPKDGQLITNGKWALRSEGITGLL
jgi:protein-glucosylgalactosylhydroxylysine glucosidase